MKPSLLLSAFAFALALAFTTQAKTKNSPYGFIENKGQIIDQNNNLNPAVKYLWTGNGMKVQLKGNSFSYEVLKTEKFKSSNPQASTPLSHRGLEMSKHGKAAMDDSTVIYSHRIDIALLGANPNPELKAEGQSEDYLNFYTTGTPEAGVTYVHQYQKVTYQNIYPNIDLEFVLDAVNKQPFKYNFIVRPGGRVGDIQLKYNGANSTELTASGSLNIATAYGNVEESIPSSYIAETGKDIAVHYQQNREGVYGFSAGNYNAQQTLVIDPWATYYGGSSGDFGEGVTTDSFNNIVIIGETMSSTNIATSGAYQTVYGGGIGDCFLAKFTQNGLRIWCTYYGGTGNEQCHGVCTDKVNNIIMYGSGGGDHIATSGSFIDSSASGGEFFSKFTAQGILVWGSYFYDNLMGISTDNANNVLLTGYADSSFINIATTGAYQTTVAGETDCFLTKFSPSCVRLWSTYYGGESFDWGWGICCDTFNNVIITGETFSTTGIATAGAFLTTKPVNDGAFITKFSDAGNLVWGTYLGGGMDVGRCVATDLNGNIFAGGETPASTGIATPGAYQSVPNGTNDYLVKFTPTGLREWGTYYGGNSTIIDQYCYDITCDKSGNVYIAGVTGATSNIATVGAYQINYGGGDADAYLAKFSNNGTMKWATYFGGLDHDDAFGVAVDGDCDVILCGSTFSDSNISTIGAYQTNLNGGSNDVDAYIASFDSTGHIPPTGINNLNQQKESFIKVYPNPAKDKITVSIKEYAGSEGTILLTTIDGKVVKSVVVKSQESSMDVKELPAGVYLIEYNNGEVCETVKVVKE